MPLPAGITPKTLTLGIPTRFNGQPASGSATLTGPVNLVHTPTGTPLFSGKVVKQFSGLSEVSFTNLVPTDAPGLNRVDWTYTLTVRVNGAVEQPDPVPFVLLSAGPDVIDADTLVEVPSSAGTPVSVSAVTSVAGLTGAVTADQLNTALGTSIGGVYSGVNVDGVHVSTLDIDSTPVTAADVGADAAGAAAAAQTAAQTYATGVAAGLALVFGA